jgi:hypothetical protein
MRRLPQQGPATRAKEISSILRDVECRQGQHGSSISEVTAGSGARPENPSLI